MISSLASVFVAKAKATPEKVVPCAVELVVTHRKNDTGCTYEVNAHDELRFTSLAALHFRCRTTSPWVAMPLNGSLTVTICGLRVAWRGRLRLLVHLLLVLRCVGMPTSRVDRRWRHRTRRSALVRMRRRTKSVVTAGVLV